VDFVLRRYTPSAALAVWRGLKEGAPLAGSHCANFERGLA